MRSFGPTKANSGIYIRIMNQKVINMKAAYEVQIWDKSPAMATASVMPPAKASPKFKAANKWSTFEIAAKEPRIILLGARLCGLRSRRRRPSNNSLTICIARL